MTKRVFLPELREIDVFRWGQVRVVLLRRLLRFLGPVDLGATVLALSPADFGKLLSNETEKWGKVVKFSGAKPG
jgi:hypothetical protein